MENRYPNSAIRYRTTAERGIQRGTPQSMIRWSTQNLRVRRASRHAPSSHSTQTEDLPEQRTHSARHHPLVYMGIAFSLLLVGGIVIPALWHWLQVTQDNLHYGYPRTSQYDQDVGHGGVSHFTVENLQGHIVIYEIVLAHPDQSKVYVGPSLSGDGADQYPATLEFKDMNNDGSLDMVITVNGNSYIWLNKDGGFHAQSQ